MKERALIVNLLILTAIFLLVGCNGSSDIVGVKSSSDPAPAASPAPSTNPVALGVLDISFNSQGWLTYGTQSTSWRDVTRDNIKIIGDSIYTTSWWMVDLYKINKSGSVDTSFGSGAFGQYDLYDDIGGLMQFTSGVLFLESGSMMMTADIYTGDSLRAPDGDFTLAKYDIGTATLDLSFNGGLGYYSYDSGIGNERDSDDTYYQRGHNLAETPDGKFVFIVAPRGVGLDYNEFHLVRVNSNGTLDTFFGTSGVALIGLPADMSSQYFYAGGPVVQSDGKILLAGTVDTLLGDSFAFVYRVNADGSPDMTFGSRGDGYVLFDGASMVAGWDSTTNIIIGPEGRIYVTGGSDDSAGLPTIWAVTTNGLLDTSFGVGGRFTIDPAVAPTYNFETYTTSGMLDANNNIVITANVRDTVNSYYGGAVIRVTSQGLLDSTFGEGSGYVIQPGNATTQFQFFDLDIDSDGSIFATGQVKEGANYQGLILKFN